MKVQALFWELIIRGTLQSLRTQWLDWRGRFIMYHHFGMDLRVFEFWLIAGPRFLRSYKSLTIDLGLLGFGAKCFPAYNIILCSRYPSADARVR